MGIYAHDTKVSVHDSQAEIERILERYGADQFMRGWDQDRAVIAFRFEKRHVRLFVSLPPKADFNLTPTGKTRTSQQAIQEAWEQACRQKWRALKLVIQAKLEAVESGISTFENEFMANILLPDGQTVGDWMGPQIEHAYQIGAMPPLLPSGDKN